MANQFISKLVREAVESVGGNYGVRFYNNYSGRAMYGKMCIGITGDLSDCMALVGEIINEAHRNKHPQFSSIVDALMAHNTDNMGLDMILYWKDLPAFEDAEEEDEVGNEG